jgi:hypothetical protein
VFSEFILVYEFFGVVRSIEKKSNPLILFFCEKRKSIGKMKKISCVDFLLKKKRKKKKK